MSKPATLAKLRELHDELAKINEGLAGAEDIEEKTIDELGQMMTDVGTLVDNIQTSGQADSDFSEHYELVDRIRNFESVHPRIVRFLSQLTDIIAMIGV